MIGLTRIPFTDNASLGALIEDMPWRLVPGRITEAAIEAFTRGACAGLALAVHDVTGWPIIEIGHCDGLPLHFMVRRPDGRLLDVRGSHTDQDVREEWELEADGTVSLASMPRSEVWDCYLHDCGEPVPMELAATFVAPVLALP